MVACSNTSPNGTSILNSFRIDDTSRIASNECPPNAKKLSSTPSTRSTSSNSSHIRHQRLFCRGSRRHILVPRHGFYSPGLVTPSGRSSRRPSTAAPLAATHADGTVVFRQLLAHIVNKLFFCQTCFPPASPHTPLIASLGLHLPEPLPPPPTNQPACH